MFDRIKLRWGWTALQQVHDARLCYRNVRRASTGEGTTPRRTVVTRGTFAVA